MQAKVSASVSVADRSRIGTLPNAQLLIPLFSVIAAKGAHGMDRLFKRDHRGCTSHNTYKHGQVGSMDTHIYHKIVVVVFLARLKSHHRVYCHVDDTLTPIKAPTKRRIATTLARLT